MYVLTLMPLIGLVCRTSNQTMGCLVLYYPHVVAFKLEAGGGGGGGGFEYIMSLF